ncbi:hypothetical protein GEMRC1_004045 [Eukaryota sp. GEM-RC1]
MNVSLFKVCTQVSIIWLFFLQHAATVSSFKPQFRPLTQISSDIGNLVGKIVVLIPGFVGTSLEQKWDKVTDHWYCSSTRDWNLSWLSFSAFLPDTVNCWVSNFEAECDWHLQQCFSSTGVETRPIGDYLNGDTYACEHINPGFKWKTGYMYMFIETLHQLGMKRGESVFALPYDFRHSVALNRHSLHDRLKDLTETAYYKNNNSPVVLLAHSMGGLLTADFLARQPSDWKAKFVKRFIAAGAPFGGSPGVYHNIVVGENYGLPTLSIDLSKRLFDKWTSVATLSPRSFLYGDEVLASIDDVEYSASNISQMYRRSDVSAHSQAEFLNWNIFAVEPEASPGVNVTLIGSTDIQVPRRYHFSSLEKGGFISTVDKFSRGDGTVEVDSMIEIAKHWQKHQVEPITWVPMKGVSHADYFMNPSFVEKLIQLL